MRSLVEIELPVDRIDRRREAKPRRQLPDRRHQIVVGERRRPLLHAEEIPRVERQNGSAARLPDAVAVAETGEGRAMPVLDPPGPRVAERLAVDRCEPGVDRDEVRARRRLRAEASHPRPSTRRRCRFPTPSSASARSAGPASRHRSRPARSSRRSSAATLAKSATLAPGCGGRADCGRRDRTCDVQSNPADEEGRFGLHRVFLHAAGRCRAGRRFQRGAERELHPALRMARESRSRTRRACSRAGSASCPSRS